MNEDDIGTFRPPEPALRVGVRDSSYLNYRAWGYISEDERILLSDEGEVYLKMDEETFGSNDALRMMFEIRERTQANPWREEPPILKSVSRSCCLSGFKASVILRLISWLKNSRIGAAVVFGNIEGILGSPSNGCYAQHCCGLVGVEGEPTKIKDCNIGFFCYKYLPKGGLGKR